MYVCLLHVQCIVSGHMYMYDMPRLIPFSFIIFSTTSASSLGDDLSLSSLAIPRCQDSFSLCRALSLSGCYVAGTENSSEHVTQPAFPDDRTLEDRRPSQLIRDKLVRVCRYHSYRRPATPRPSATCHLLVHHGPASHDASTIASAISIVGSSMVPRYPRACEGRTPPTSALRH